MNDEAKREIVELRKLLAAMASKGSELATVVSALATAMRNLELRLQILEGRVL